jgi:murein DD-endopeptidase MepM/ murein hydrolase activator NlpD
LKGVGYLLIASVRATGAFIYKLVNDAYFARLKQIELENKSLTLSEEVSSLKSLKASLEGDLLEREEKIQLVSDKLGDLEKVLGMGETSSELESRLDTAAITSSVRMVMLTQIPSGSPVQKGRISSSYGKRVHPVTGKTAFHRGQFMHQQMVLWKSPVGVIKARVIFCAYCICTDLAVHSHIYKSSQLKVATLYKRVT